MRGIICKTSIFKTRPRAKISCVLSSLPKNLFKQAVLLSLCTSTACQSPQKLNLSFDRHHDEIKALSQAPETAITNEQRINYKIAASKKLFARAKAIRNDESRSITNRNFAQGTFLAASLRAVFEAYEIGPSNKKQKNEIRRLTNEIIFYSIRDKDADFRWDFFSHAGLFMMGNQTHQQARFISHNGQETLNKIRGEN